MHPQVQEASRQVFELDDNRVRIFCRPQFVRPPTQGQLHATCCQPGQNPLTRSTTLAPENYDYYTGEGAVEYIDTETEDVGRLQAAPEVQKAQVKRRKQTRRSTTAEPLVKEKVQVINGSTTRGRNGSSTVNQVKNKRTTQKPLGGEDVVEGIKK